jgi:histidine triad (HIT) family protein
VTQKRIGAEHGLAAPINSSATRKPAMIDDCLLCRIAAHQVGAHVVHEDDQLVAFLDICPIRPGHTLIMTKQHFPYFDDLPANLAASIVVLGQRFAAVMKRVYGVERVAFLFTGGDIPHAHAHIVPFHEKTDITSRRYIAEEQLTFRDTPRAPERELRDTAALLMAALKAGG